MATSANTMATSAKFSLKLLVDEKKNKVVLAEAGQDFVDVLFGLMTLPMGTIARLLAKHQKLPQFLGCYKNLNRSVSDMVIDDFETEACKSMLLSPKSSHEIHCRRLTLNIDDTQATNFYVCPKLYESDSCKAYTNFCSSRCRCGSLMNIRVRLPEDEQVIGSIGNAVDGVFVSCRSSFIITDDLKVMLNSIDELVKVLNGLGYPNLSELQEMVLDVGSDEVLTLLGNLFASESPLTSTFLRKQCMPTMLTWPPPPMLKTGRAEQGRECYIKTFVGKSDRKILYAECSEDFIDSLLTFLVLPLESASSLSNNNTILGCVKNLCRCECRRELPYRCCLPAYYTCSKNLLDIASCSSGAYECLIPKRCFTTSLCKFSKRIERSVLEKGDKVVALSPMDPKDSKSCSSMIVDTGFVKRNTKFIVSDDLVITPMNKFSTIGLLKKMEINMKDIEARPICIKKAELINILSASLISSSALTNGLSSLLAKKPKIET
ncbi:PREDICTED: uncharacterized protein LOC104764608 [Camelina sativa]|uniref:Uncharacterized protein LOC104764608 n=1 Tax=Camelina sativa TaxID=90675 RepID=A0ABM0XIH0_CAMSA|nr:PREDICTED: uncharacterized protein LOC104764608 [Camelina sativa]